ncbi:MAG: aspartyl protease family protein, partial [Sphingorhabdus sp.]
MDAKQLAPLFALVIAIGWFFPHEEVPQPVGVSVKAASPQIAAISSPSGPDLGYDPVIIDRTPNGHFYTTANIRGNQVRFLIDTGASMIALTGEDARAL